MTGPLVQRLGTSVHVARPIFQVLNDESQDCVCDVTGPSFCISNYESMRIPADEYARTDRLFL